MRAALLKANAKKKKFQKRKKEVVIEEDSDSSLSSDDEQAYSENMIGRNINNKYMILKYLGRGTFSKVWLVLDLESSKYYALKIQEPQDLEEIKDEIDFLKILQKDVKNSEDKYYGIGRLVEDFKIRINGYDTVGIVMELLGDNIGFIIGEMPLVSRLTIIKKIIRQLALSLKHIHSLGIVHTDMKVDNILLNQLSPDIREYIGKINNLQISQEYNKLLQESIPKEIHLLDKKKRKVVKRKIKSKVQKEIEKLFLEKINILNLESQNNLKLDIQEINTLDSDNSDYDNQNDDDILEGDEVEYDWNNLDIKIIDFGNSEREIYIEEQEVYTRSYRPPENIIKKQYSTKSDIWFVGCLLYELLTEEILFNIDSIEKNQKDKEHLKQMHQYLGLLPRSMFQNNKLDDDVFDFNKFEMEDMSIRDCINDEQDLDENELDLIEDLMFKLLEYEPDKRISAAEILNHKWLQEN